MEANFKFYLVTNDTQFTPKRSSDGPAGYDVFARLECDELKLWNGEIYKIPLGIMVLPAPGWWLDVRPRSSSFLKKGHNALYGVDDEDFYGELHYCFKYEGAEQSVISNGEKIAQIIPMQRHSMNIEVVSKEDFDKEYNSRFKDKHMGFGSTGNK